MRYRVTVLIHEGHSQEQREDTFENAALTRQWGISADSPREALLELGECLKPVVVTIPTDRSEAA